ncbi:MAG: hypothetical protein APF81_03865 [Desulfosporosinus sp. BRH_c37]|nr:MAG: hypothetical protein APF81_03865 [Desulfosporosinus sp. BRH_c37]
MSSRKIEFRGKRIDNGEWVVGCLYYFNHESNPSKPVRCFISPINQTAYANGEPVEEWEVVPETVGEFAGRELNDGTKIFEGDILPGEYGNSTLVVTFADSMFLVVGEDESTDTATTLWHYVNSFGDEGWLEVIGNIHDNGDSST